MPPKQIQSLQVLRAVAATSVVYYHTFLDPHVGSFGVDLFFVLSGFVISMVAESGLTPREFLINRITRIAPLYWVMTTMVLGVAAIKPDLLNSTTANVISYFKSILFVPYFKENGALHPMLAVGWTLNYEMLFYVLAGAAIWAFDKKWFFFVTTALVVASWSLGHMLSPTSPAGAFLRSDLLFEFILGMLVWKCRNFAFKGIPAFVGLAAVLLLYFLMVRVELSGPPYRSLAYGLPSFFLVLAALQLESTFSSINPRCVKFLSHIGDASYATYLSHLFVIQFVRKVLASQFPAISTDGVLGAAIAVICSLCIGTIVFLIIDKPLVRFARSLTKYKQQGTGPGDVRYSHKHGEA